MTAGGNTRRVSIYNSLTTDHLGPILPGSPQPSYRHRSGDDVQEETMQIQMKLVYLSPVIACVLAM